MNELASNDTRLLVALYTGRHFKAKPGELGALLPDIEEPEALASFRRVLGAGFVKTVTQQQPGIWLRITDAGMARAQNTIEAQRKPAFFERLKLLPFGKAAWDVFKIGLGAVLGILATKYFGS